MSGAAIGLEAGPAGLAGRGRTSAAVAERPLPFAVELGLFVLIAAFSMALWARLVEPSSADRQALGKITAEGVFLSWRLLASEATGSTGTGLAGPDFAIYRDGERIADVTDSTNYADADGAATSSYTVAPVVNGVELDASAPVTPGRRDTTICRSRSPPTA